MFLFSCEIRSWVCVSVNLTCQVNTAESNTLVHSIVTNKSAKFGAKIFRHFSDIAIFVWGYFILPHPVHMLNKDYLLTYLLTHSLIHLLNLLS